jgi:hypothetical protein
LRNKFRNLLRNFLVPYYSYSTIETLKSKFITLFKSNYNNLNDSYFLKWILAPNDKHAYQIERKFLFRQFYKRKRNFNLLYRKKY